MNPDDIIDSYVSDVVRRLPRRQRRDVGLELRSLLGEEIAGRAADTDRPADAAMTMELLTAFGRPQDVADRYRPAGFTVIRPADAPRFTWVALGGVVVQWVISLGAVFGPAAGPGSDFWSRLSVWWLSWGLGSFWWPGFLITLTLIAGAVGAARERIRSRGGAAEPRPWTPARVIDRDRVVRPVLVLYIALGMLGATIVIALPSLGAWAPGLPEPVLAAFAFDPEFLRWRAPWALLLWGIAFGASIGALIAGRWTRALRRLSLAGSIGWLALVAWWIVAGPIFIAEPTDSTTKLCLLVVSLLVVLDVVASLRRLIRDAGGTPKQLRVPKLGAKT